MMIAFLTTLLTALAIGVVRYRKVSTVIWNDEKFRTLSANAQLVFFFVLTHPHMTSLGAMRGTIDGLAAEHKKWPAKAFREAFQEALQKNLVEIDEDANFIGLPNFLKHNPPESPNVVKSWEKVWGDIPECPLKAKLAQRVKGFAKGLGDAFLEALPDAFAKGMPNQELEPELEPEQDISNSQSVTDRFLKIWNSAPGVKSITKMSASRVKALNTRLAETINGTPWLDTLETAVIERFPLKCFIGSKWQPNGDWILKADSVLRIVEGTYDWEKEATATGKSNTSDPRNIRAAADQYLAMGNGHA